MFFPHECSELPMNALAIMAILTVSLSAVLFGGPIFLRRLVSRYELQISDTFYKVWPFYCIFCAVALAGGWVSAIRFQMTCT